MAAINKLRISTVGINAGTSRIIEEKLTSNDPNYTYTTNGLDTTTREFVVQKERD